MLIVNPPEETEQQSEETQSRTTVDYLEFDDHPLSDIESLMDPDKPAPWDHLNNDEDDEDVDIDIKEKR